MEASSPPSVPTISLITWSPGRPADWRRPAAILAHTATLTDQRGRQRHSIIATFRYTGARAGEVSNLRRDRIDLDARRLEVLGKGARHRTLAIPAPLAAVLSEFLVEVRPQLPDTPYLFVNDHPLVPDPDRRCSIWSLQRETRLAAEGAGLPGRHHPHRWRHSFATELIRAGVSVAHVQRQLGHASIVSTMIYTHLEVDDVRQSLDEVFDRPDRRSLRLAHFPSKVFAGGSHVGIGS